MTRGNTCYTRGTMSALNGDKARHGAQRKRKLARRIKIRDFKAKQAGPAAQAASPSVRPDPELSANN